MVVACPIPRLDPKNIENTNTFSTCFIILQHALSLLRYSWVPRVSTTRQLGFRSDPGIAVTDIRFRGERIVYELALMDAQAIYGGSLRDQFMCLAETAPGEKWIQMCTPKMCDCVRNV